MKKSSLLTFSLLAASIVCAQPALAKNHIYTESNTTANQILHFEFTDKGKLVEVSKVLTKGAGTNGFKPITGEKSAPDTLLSAGAVTLSADHKLLFAVNAGDNSVSSFHVAKNGKLTFADHQVTGEKGTTNSVTYDSKSKTLYVLHSLGPNHITAFKVKNGKLEKTQKAYSVNTDLAKDRVATHAIVSPDGKFLLVDVLFNARPKAGDAGPVLTPANAGTADGVVVFAIGKNGELGSPILNDAGGPTPFSLTFLNGSKDTFVNTLAAGNGVVLSQLNSDGTIKNIGKSTIDLSLAPNGPSETCWVTLSPDNKFAYSANFGLGTISSYKVTNNSIDVLESALHRMEGDGTYKAFAGISTAGPNDMWASKNGYLFQLYPNASKLVAYKMNGKDLEKVASAAIPYNSTVGLTGF